MGEKKQKKEDDIDKVNKEITWVDVSAGSATHFALEGAPPTEEFAADTEVDGVSNKEHIESNQSKM